jgi:hypothetical protein
MGSNVMSGANEHILYALSTSPAWREVRPVDGRYFVLLVMVLVVHYSINSRFWDGFPRLMFSGHKISPINEFMYIVLKNQIFSMAKFHHVRLIGHNRSMERLESR